jgi:cytoskeleton protein RodZ
MSEVMPTSSPGDAPADNLEAADGTAQADALPATPGQLLRQAREAMGQSAADVAAKLRMGVKQIQALEAGDYAALPTGTFLRGFVRNYAQAMGLDPKVVLARLEETHSPARAVHATPVVEPARQKMAVRTPAGLFASPQLQGVLVAGVILLLAGAVAYWWTFVRGEATRTATTAVPAPLQAAPAPTQTQPETKIEAAQLPPTEAPAGAVSVAPPQTEAPMAIPVSPQAEPAPKEKAAKTAEPEKKPRAAGSSVVGLTFSGDSWVEITDANGRVILSKKFRAGDAEEVTGRGPLSVIVGNASNTRMALNGLEFDLSPHTRGAVARVNAK